MSCYCYLRNIVDLLITNETAYHRRFQVNFAGPTYPFGCEIKYKPISKDDMARSHKFGDKLLPGIFLGYELQAGAGWSGDLILADWDEIQEAECFSEVYPKRFKAGEVHPVMKNETYQFPIAEGNLRQPGGKIIEYVRRTRKPPENKDEEDDTIQNEAESKTQHDKKNEEEIFEPDFWSVTADVLIRHHRTPRLKKFQPDEVGDCPLPPKYLDVMRLTRTNLDTLAEKEIEDIWCDQGPAELSAKWTGSTTFDILRPKPPDGMTWVEGRPTKVQKTTRPPNIRTERWQGMSKKLRQQSILDWAINGKAIEEARTKRGFHYVPTEDKDYLKILSDARLKHAPPPVPGMPTIKHGTAVICQGGTSADRNHQDHVATSGYCSNEWHALVHTPIPLKKAYESPRARAAIDAEHDKLNKKTAWDFTTVRAKADVIADAKKKGKRVNFGNLMELCHEKHSELKLAIPTYKGRLVFRGDQVRDETGYYAVFSEQGTSASHMDAAKMIDAMGRMPGNKVEDSDAIGAYHQVSLKDAHLLLGGTPDDFVETWVSFENMKHRRPKSWDKIEDPVCILRLTFTVIP